MAMKRSTSWNRMGTKMRRSKARKSMTRRHKTKARRVTGKRRMTRKTTNRWSIKSYRKTGRKMNRKTTARKSMNRRNFKFSTMKMRTPRRAWRKAA